MLNKRADLSVTIFTLLVFLLFTATAGNFVWNHRTISSSVFGHSYVEVLNKEYSNAKSFLSQISEEVFLEVYSEYLSEGKYISFLKITSGKNVFGDFNEQVKDNFLKDFSLKLNSRLKKLSFREGILKNKGDASVKMDEDKIEIFLEIINYSRTFEKINISSSAPVKTKIDFNEKGVVDFSELYTVKENCKDFKEENLEEKENLLEVIKKCYSESLKNFNFEIKEIPKDKESYVFVEFSTKRKFLVENKFVSAKFSFIQK
jgi:hypothetical protein